MAGKTEIEAAKNLVRGTGKKSSFVVNGGFRYHEERTATTLAKETATYKKTGKGRIKGMVRLWVWPRLSGEAALKRALAIILKRYSTNTGGWRFDLDVERKRKLAEKFAVDKNEHALEATFWKEKNVA